jgi:hypothetical protein
MKDLFKDKTVIITGVGRSGTTILGKIIGSMDPVFYLFEPALTKYIASFPYSDIFCKILFEDYFLGLVHGRGNMNPHDWSYAGNHEELDSIRYRRARLRRRSDALEWIQKNQPLWVIKNPEFTHLMEYAHTHFPGIRYLHILRNGLDVVRSSMERGWYTDKYCNEDIVEQTYNFDDIRVPHFVSSPEDRVLWQKWDPITRAACAWRSLTEQGIKYKHRNKDSVIQFRYKDFCKQPKRYSNYIADKLDLTITDLTKEHIGEVFNKPSDDLEIPVSHIAEPERAKFKKLNEKLGYEV